MGKPVRRIISTLCIVLAGITFLSFSGLPQGTEVWLFTYTWTGKNFAVESGINISNHKGYDNQPSFSENGTYLLWTSERDSGQTEIYRYDLAGKSSKRITMSKVSEYSPTFMTGNKYISAVVVEKDSVQRLWKYHKETAKPSLVLPRVFGVGYHCWYDESTVFVFQLTDPVSLVMCETRSKVTKIVAKNIGRCMQTYKTPKKKLLLYTQKDEEGKLTIQAMDKNGAKDPSFKPIPCLEGSEDFSVDKRGNIVMGSGSKLYMWDIEKGTEWVLAADLSTYGIKNISRIAMSPDGIHFSLVDNQE